MKRKKILFHINSMGKGGAESVVNVLSGFFAEDNYEVIIVTLWYAENEYELSEKVKRINLPEKAAEYGRAGRAWQAIQRLFQFRKILNKEKPDIVISFCNKANFRCSYAMLGMKIPLLVSVRNDPQKDYLPYRHATAHMEKKAAGCVFQTPDARAAFGAALQKKSKIICNPVDDKYIKAARTDIAGRKPYIVSVGRIAAQKNHLLLLKAFNRIQKDFPDYSVRIYGEDGEPQVKQQLLAYIKEQKLEARVKFMGQSSTLEKEIAQAAVFVLPSDYEGMPNALMEAMVLGLPVIATDCPCGGSGLLIEDGVSGCLVPVEDEEKLAQTLEMLLRNPAKMQELASHAREIAEKVNPHAIYEEWKKYVEELYA